MRKMKTIIKYCLILSCLLQASHTEGQNFVSTLNQFISKVKSIEDFAKISVDIDDYNESVLFNSDSYHQIFRISLKDSLQFSEIVDLINSIKLKEDPWGKSAVYQVYKAIIKENRYKNNDVKVKLIESSLQNSESLYGNVYSDLKYLNNSFFSAKSISRISDIINIGLNDTEVHLKCLMYNKNLMNLADTNLNKRLSKQLNDCTKDSAKSLEYCLDSLNNEILSAYKNHLKQRFTVNSELIFLIGNALLDKLIPDLIVLMNRNPSNETLIKNIKLVLCRLEYKQFVDGYLVEIENFVGNDAEKVLQIERELLYINSQESLYYLSKFINANIWVSCDLSNENAKSEKYGYYLIFMFSRIITNSPQQYKHLDSEFIWSFCDVVDSYPEDALNDFGFWMKSNKGGYVINKDFLKF